MRSTRSTLTTYWICSFELNDLKDSFSEHELGVLAGNFTFRIKERQAQFTCDFNLAIGSDHPLHGSKQARPSWLWDLQGAADFLGEEVRNLCMSWDWFTAACSRTPVDRMGTAFTFERAAVGYEVANELSPLHARARGISLSPLPRLARASSRRSSIRSRMDSRSDSSDSSSVSPCPLPSGNSGEKATNHSPSRKTRAVNVAACFMCVECVSPQHAASLELGPRVSVWWGSCVPLKPKFD
jgi:hypothetical protein